MSDNNLTVGILREIRDEIRTTRTDLAARIDETNARLGRLEIRTENVEARLGKIEEALRDLAAQQLMLTRYVKNVVDRHEKSIADLRERVTRLEARRAK